MIQTLLIYHLLFLNLDNLFDRILLILFDLKNIDDIKTAIDDGWVITFPQGTTKPFAPIRKGTAHIIQKNDPVVVPIIIDGFRRAFDKSGLRLKKRGINLKLKIKEPVKFNLKKESIESITTKIKELIEQ